MFINKRVYLLDTLECLLVDFFTPGPWFVRFSLVRFSYVHLLKTVPKYLVRKFVLMCIIDIICAFLVCAGFF